MKFLDKVSVAQGHTHTHKINPNKQKLNKQTKHNANPPNDLKDTSVRLNKSYPRKTSLGKAHLQ